MTWHRALIFGIPIVIFLIIFFAGYARPYEVPKNMQVTPITGGWKTFLGFLAIPEDWMYMPAAFYLFVVPFAGIWVILWGFLRELRIFNIPNINGLLAFIIAFSTIPLGFFVRLVSTLFATIGVYGVVAFAALAVLGIAYIFIQRVSGWYPGGPLAGVAREQRYNRLRDWLLTAAHDNAGAPQVAGIPGMLTRAERDWAAGRRENAVRRLEHDMTDVRNQLRAVGLNVPLGP